MLSKIKYFVAFMSTAFITNVNSVQASMAEIPFEQFAKIGFRFGTIISAIPFPEARNPSYKIAVDFGDGGTKSSSAQLPANYTLEELSGKQVVGVVNLPIRRIAGFKSEALVVGFPDIKDKVRLLNTRGYKLPNGYKLVESGTQSEAINYDDFQNSDIRVGIIERLQTLETEARSFYADLDMGSLGKRKAFLGDLDKEIAFSLINSKIAALTNLKSECISDQGYDATILTFWSDINKTNRIPLGVDGDVPNGGKLF